MVSLSVCKSSLLSRYKVRHTKSAPLLLLYYFCYLTTSLLPFPSHHLLQPFGNRRLRQWHNGMGRSCQTTHLRMRDVGMAVPASQPFALLRLGIRNHSRLHEFRIQLRMTTNAVVHNHFVTLFTRPDSQGFGPEREHRRVQQAVFRFESILFEDIVVRNMAIVTRSPASVRTVIPRLIIGSHDVAVDARGRIVREVNMHPRHINGISSQSCDHASENEERQDQPVRYHRQKLFHGVRSYFLFFVIIHTHLHILFS